MMLFGIFSKFGESLSMLKIIIKQIEMGKSWLVGGDGGSGGVGGGGGGGEGKFALRINVQVLCS